MRQCQKALIHHIKQAFSAPVYTVEEYAGELKAAINKTNYLPAILAIYIDGTPAAQDPVHQFDLLVIVQNKELDKSAANKKNLQLASDVVAYIKAKFSFHAQGGLKGLYEIDRESLTARTILNNDRFNIVGLSLFITDYT